MAAELVTGWLQVAGFEGSEEGAGTIPCGSEELSGADLLGSLGLFLEPLGRPILALGLRGDLGEEGRGEARKAGRAGTEDMVGLRIGGH